MAGRGVLGVDTVTKLSISCISRCVDSKFVRCYIATRLGMTFHPNPTCDGPHLLPFRDQVPKSPNKTQVIDPSFSFFRSPAVRLHLSTPIPSASESIFAIREDRDSYMLGSDLQCTNDCHYLCALICLAYTW